MQVAGNYTATKAKVQLP